MKMELLGVRYVDFEKDGDAVIGYSLFCANPAENVCGLETSKLWVGPKMMGLIIKEAGLANYQELCPEDVTYSIDVEFNRYGKPMSIKLLNV